ncbi:hypothetical protein bpuCAU1_000240 [Borrelia puertoricensis]
MNISIIAVVGFSNYHENNPSNKVIIAVSSSPSARKYLGLLRAEIFSIINLENPYAIETPDKAIPNWPLLKLSFSSFGIANEKIFLVK